MRKSAGFERLVQRAALAIKPAAGGELVFVGLAGAVHPDFAVGSVIAVERFEHRSAPWPRHRHGGCAGKLSGDKTVLKLDLIGIAKEPPRESDGAGLGEGGKEGRKRMIAHVDIDKFVDIQCQNPVGLAGEPVL